MKMTRTILFLLTLLPLGAYAGDIESVDVVLDSLNFEMPKDGNGAAGELRFRSLDFYSTDLFINLYDDGEVFNSTMYLRPDFFGIRGKNHALGLNLDTTPLKGLNSLDLLRSSVGFNEKQVSFDSEELAIRHDMIDLNVDNFRFFCKKHPDFPGNDVEAFKYGCLSDSTFGPLDEASPVGIEATVNDIDKNGSKAHIATKVNSVEFKTQRIFMSVDDTAVEIDKMLKLDVDHMALTCKKNGDIANFDPNELIFDCIDDVAFKVNNLSVDSTIESEEGEIQNLKLSSKNPSIVLDEKHVSIKTEAVNVQLDNIEIEGSNIHLSCDKNREGVSNKDFDLLMRTCLDTSNIKELNDRYADFKIKLADETIGDVVVDASLKAIDMKDGDFSTEMGYTRVNVGNLITAGTHGLKLSCETNLQLPKEISKENMDAIDFEKSMNSCLTTVKVPKSQIFLSNAERDGRYFLDINAVDVRDGSVRLDIPAIQLVSKEGSNTIFNLSGLCFKKKDVMPYDYKALIDECLKDGRFNISSIVNDEDNDEARNIMSVYDRLETEQGRNINPVDLVRKISPSMKNLSITAKNGYVTVKTQTKVLGMLKSATIAGYGRFDQKNEKLILDVKETDLPFGISSRKLSLFIIKQIIADDRVKISTSNKTITIDLKF